MINLVLKFVIIFLKANFFPVFHIDIYFQRGAVLNSQEKIAKIYLKIKKLINLLIQL